MADSLNTTFVIVHQMDLTDSQITMLHDLFQNNTAFHFTIPQSIYQGLEHTPFILLQKNHTCLIVSRKEVAFKKRHDNIIRYF